MSLFFGLLLTTVVTVYGGKCPTYEEVATKEAAQLDPKRYEGFWYEVASANVFLTEGCECTRYNYTLTTGTESRETKRRPGLTFSCTDFLIHCSLP